MMRILIRPLERLLVARSTRRQRQTRLRDPGLWDASVDERGHLQVDGVALPGVMEQHGSPAFVVSHAKLTADVARIREACERAGGVRAYYSYKTNGIPGILREIHALGVGAEVVSPWELWLAERLGLSGDDIIYNGVNKTDESLRRAVALDVMSINVDDLEEIDRIRGIAESAGRPARVGVRLRLEPSSHFGLDVANGEARAGVERIRRHAEWLRLSSLQFHLVACARDSSRHRALTRKALSFLDEVQSRLGRRVPFLDVGGGFGVSTSALVPRWEYAFQRFLLTPPAPHEPEAHQDFGEYLRDLATTVDEFCSRQRMGRPELIIEPGRVATSQSEMLVSRVHGVKRNHREPHFAMTDAGRVLVSYPCDYEYHHIFAANRMRDPLTTRYHLMGRLCTSADWLARNRLFPELRAGDTLAVMDAGAYFSSYSSNFAFPRPAVVLARRGETAVLRRGESYEHLCAMDEG